MNPFRLKRDLYSSLDTLIWLVVQILTSALQKKFLKEIILHFASWPVDLLPGQGRFGETGFSDSTLCTK